MRTIIRSILLVSLLVVPAAGHARVFISEVLWAGSPQSTADEWLELGYWQTDGEPSVVDLAGWELVTLLTAGEQTIVRFGTGVSLQHGQTLLIANDTAAESALAFDADIITAAVSLPNTGLRVSLRNAAGEIMDVAGAGSGLPPAGSNSSTAGKASMERIDPVADGALASSWVTATISVGLDPGVLLFGTPGQLTHDSPPATPAPLPITESQPPEETRPDLLTSSGAQTPDAGDTQEGLTASGSGQQEEGASADDAAVSNILPQPTQQPYVHVPLLRVNEVLADPVGMDTNEWIELYAQSGETIDLSQWTVSLSGATTSYRFASGTVLQHGEYALLTKTQTALTLPNEGGVVQLHKNGQYMGSMQYDKTAEGVSMGVDATGALAPFCVPTPGEENTWYDLQPQMNVQSRSTNADGSVSLNVEALLEGGSLETVRCAWEYGDGTQSLTCNPPSHRISMPGTHDVVLRMTSYCGTTVTRSMQVIVAERQSSSASRSSGASSSSSSERQEACDPPATTGVSILRVLPRPQSGGEERIVLGVDGDAPTLCGLLLDDAEGGSAPFDLQGIAPDHSGRVELVGGQTKIHWNDDGDRVRLLRRAADGALSVVQEVSYESAPQGAWLVIGRDGALYWDGQSSSSAVRSDGALSSVPALANELQLLSVHPKPRQGDKEWIAIKSVAEKQVSTDGWLLDTGGKSLSRAPSIVLSPGEVYRLSGGSIRLRDEDGLLRLIAPSGVSVGAVAWQQALEAQTYDVPSVAPTVDAVFHGMLADGSVRLTVSDLPVTVRLEGILLPTDPVWPLAGSRYTADDVQNVLALQSSARVQLSVSEQAPDGRWSGTVFLAGISLQERLLQAGHALVSSHGTAPAQRDALVVCEALARSAHSGIWAQDATAAEVKAWRSASARSTATPSHASATVRTARTPLPPSPLRLAAVPAITGAAVIDVPAAPVRAGQALPGMTFAGALAAAASAGWWWVRRVA